MKIDAKIEYKKLKNIINALAKEWTVKVGLLSEKGGSKEISENLDLAGLGAVQEFGCDIKITQKMAGYLALTAKELGLPKLETQGDGYIHIPARSFLQMPLSRKGAVINELKKQLGTNLEDIAYHFAKTGDMQTLAIMLGVSAREVVIQAFETGGFGQWKPNSQLTVALKGSNNPLQNTGELWKHIDYKAEKNG